MASAQPPTLSLSPFECDHEFGCVGLGSVATTRQRFSGARSECPSILHQQLYSHMQTLLEDLRAQDCNSTAWTRPIRARPMYGHRRFLRCLTRRLWGHHTHGKSWGAHCVGVKWILNRIVGRKEPCSEGGGGRDPLRGRRLGSCL